jgi:hypothetical protein
MIRYALRCEQGHGFDSWFPSSSAYDRQVKQGLVECPRCGSVKVEKAIMAPQIARKKGRDPVSEPAVVETATPAPAPISAEADSSSTLMLAQERELRTKLRELREHITKVADNVGPGFADEARKMHYGEIEQRPIYGQASTEEARALIDEGIEVTPLPLLPDDRN